MNKYEDLFRTLTDKEIHEINRDIPDSAELESAINDWFLNPIKYNETEIIQNIKIENEKNNIFSMLTLAIWYREGIHITQSDSAYAETLEKIITVKTNNIDSDEILTILQKGKAKNQNQRLYGEVLGESSLQLGTYYSTSKKNSDLEKAKKFFTKAKWYAPLTVASAIPIIGPTLGIIGGIGTAIGFGASVTGGIAAGAAGAAGLAGVATTTAIPIVGPLITIGGLTTVGIAAYRKKKAKKKSILSKKYSKSPITKTAGKYEKGDKKSQSPEKIAKQCFGNLWDDLLNESQISITSAYYTYYMAQNIESYDYSAVIAPLGKALEGELKIRFYDGYMKYLIETFATPENYKEYNNLTNTQFDSRSKSLFYITNKTCQFADYIHHPNFRIGSLRFILGIDKAGNTYNRKTFCDQSVIDYTQKILYSPKMNKKTKEEIDNFLKELSDNVDTLRKLRNEADHPGANLTIEDANKVLNIMIYTKKILLKLLDPTDSFKDRVS